MRIVTDSAADLTPEDIRTWNIQVMPFPIQFPNEAVMCDQIAPDDFYDRLQAMVPHAPSTSQPSLGAMTELYAALSSGGDDVLAVHVSSGLSGTANVARLAAQNFANVTTVDSLTLSSPLRFQVLAAAMAAQKGWSVDRITDRLNQIQQASEGIYTLETLDYLIRGGRIGRVQAIAGTLLRIKPIIHVDPVDGKYSTIGKSRTVGKALGTIVDYLKAKYGDQPVWTTTLHGQMATRAGELQAMLNDALNVGRADMVRISPVLGVHTGPGIVGCGVMPMELIADLLPEQMAVPV
jgi:DegV family protein with EDD domain